MSDESTPLHTSQLADVELDATVGGEIFFAEDPCTVRLDFWFADGSFPLVGSYGC